MDITEIRQKYPEYSDLSDDELARGFHKKFYADIPFEDFSSKIGLDKTEQNPALEEALAKRRSMGRIAPGGFYAPDIAMGLRSPIDAGAQMLTRGIEQLAPAGSGFEKWAQGQRQNVEAVNAKAQQEYQQQYAPQQVTGAGLAKGVGETLPFLLSPMGAAPTVLGRTAQAGAIGAGIGAATPVANPADNFWSQKAEQIGVGGVTNAALNPAFEIASRVVSPRVSPYVKKLMDEGVTPTPGGVMGGTTKRIEEALVSVPLLGDMIKSSQRASIKQFNTAMYVRALAPLGKEAEDIARRAPVGSEGIRIVGDTLSNAYEDALAKSVPNVVIPSRGVPPEINRAATEFVSAIKQTEGMVPRALRGDFTDALQTHVFSKVTPGGTLTPSVAKDAESSLGRLAVGYMRSASESERQLGQALRQAQEELRSLVMANNPTIAPVLKNINNGWRSIVQLEKAGAQTGAKERIFTPAQFMSEVRNTDPSMRKRAFARGESFNQDLGTAGEAALSSQLPDSGTIMRGMVAGGTLGAAAHFINPTVAGVMGSLTIPYMPGMRRLTANAMTKRPKGAKTLGELLSDPYAGAAFTSSWLE